MKSVILFVVATVISLNVYSSQNQTHFKKVVWITFENENFDPVMNQTDFAQYAGQGVLLSQLMAETHPSQPNYISMIAGSALGVPDDKNIDLSANHIGDLLENKNLDWRVYAESYPENCFAQPRAGDFVRKHVPFLSFVNVTRNPQRCAKIRNEKNFQSDFRNDTLPAFTMYVPNMKNDGHDTSVDFAGKWLTKNFGYILNHPENLKDYLFVITFDESGSKSGSNKVYTVLIGNNIIKGSNNTQPLSHIALLKMIEDEFGLGNLGRYDVSAPVVENIWKN